MIELVRSGDLFGMCDSDQRNIYFDSVAACDGNVVPPEAVFGRNGWQRRLAETGADPEDAAFEFERTWDSMPVSVRRDWAYSNALARYAKGPGYEDRVGMAAVGDMENESLACADWDRSKATVALNASVAGPVAANRLLFTILFGED